MKYQNKTFSSNPSNNNFRSNYDDIFVKTIPFEDTYITNINEEEILNYLKGKGDLRKLLEEVSIKLREFLGDRVLPMIEINQDTYCQKCEPDTGLIIHLGIKDYDNYEETYKIWEEDWLNWWIGEKFTTSHNKLLVTI